VTPAGGNLVAGDISNAGYNMVEYDGANWRLAAAYPKSVNQSYTPIVAGSGTAGNQTYTVQLGEYTVIGKLCYFNLNITLATKDAAASGNTVLSAPFVSKSNGMFSSMNIGFYSGVNLDAGYTQLEARIDSNTLNITLIQVGDSIAAAGLPIANISGTAVFQISGTYLLP
jgi:hypothetical protein